VLRKSQIHMVRDYKQAMEKGTGMVKQMIMGAGNNRVTFMCSTHCFPREFACGSLLSTLTIHVFSLPVT
jgi:hypothetical protein